MSVIDKASWHIVGGEDKDKVILRFMQIFKWLNINNKLTPEGYEIFSSGIDESICLHDRLITEDTADFFEKYYDDFLKSVDKDSRNEYEILSSFFSEYKATLQNKLTL